MSFGDIYDVLVAPITTEKSEKQKAELQRVRLLTQNRALPRAEMGGPYFGTWIKQCRKESARDSLATSPLNVFSFFI